MLKTMRSVLRFRRFEFSASKRRLARAANVDDLRSIAKKRLPAGVFDYIDGGAEDESALFRNTAVYRRIEFRPRVLRDVSGVDTSTTLLGKPLAYPLVLSPTGFNRIADPQGELAVARAAARAGIPYTLSMALGTRSLEEIAEVSDGPKWFQVYVWRDRGLVKEMIERAAAAGFETLVLTVDTAVFGRRERDVRRGYTLPPKLGLDTLFDGMRHPAWTWRFVRNEPIVFSNIKGRDIGDGTDAVVLADYVNSQFDPSLSWKDLGWLRSVWDGPIVLKGIQTTEDAEIAVAEGVEAITLSNHGGRQLDSAPAIVELLPEIVEAVGGQIEIICDGGVRRGADIVKAVALGATACMAGRPYLYGLASGGERGVDQVLSLLAGGMARTMSLIGCRDVSELGPEMVRLPIGSSDPGA